MDNDWVTPRRAANILRVTPPQLTELIRAGVLEYRINWFGRSRVRVTVGDAAAWGLAFGVVRTRRALEGKRGPAPTRLVIAELAKMAACGCLKRPENSDLPVHTADQHTEVASRTRLGDKAVDAWMAAHGVQTDVRTDDERQIDETITPDEATRLGWTV